MLNTLVKKEVLNQLITLKALIIILVTIILAVVSTLVMSESYLIRVQNYELLKSGSSSLTIRQPQPMSVFSVGLDEELSGRTGFRQFGEITIGKTQKSTLGKLNAVDVFDFQFVVAVVMSLAALLFTFDSVSGEKEQQTLKLMLSNSIGREKVILAKWLASVIIILIPLVLGFLSSLIMVTFLAPAVFSLDLVLRLLLLFAASLLLCAVFAGLGLLFSVLNESPAVSLIVAILCWSVLVFVTPSTLSSLSESIVGGKSEAQYEVEKTNMWGGELFKLSNTPGMEYESQAYDRGMLDMSYKYASGFKDYLNQEEKRVELAGNLNLLNPVGNFNFIAWDISGSGPGDVIEYKKQLLDYHELISNEYFRLGEQRRKTGERVKSEMKFSEKHRSIEDVFFASLLPGAGFLFLEMLIIFLASYFAFLKYDIR